MFSSKQLYEGTWRIRTAAGVICYLLEGEERAFLIDTGLGVGSLRAYVESLTDKPVTVLLTHGHMDHAMGAPEFDEVYMNPLEEEIYDWQCDPRLRIRVTERFMAQDHAVWGEHMIPSQPLRYKPLLPGMRFELGKRTLEIYDGGGHTRGSICILIPEDRVLILGDACERNTMLLIKYSLTVREYRERMRALEAATRGRYDTCWFFHGHGEDRAGYVESILEVCDLVLRGEDAAIPYRYFNDELLLALPRDEHLRRLDGGLADLAYAKGKEK
ncbi:MAG: MBL fold metallo-hydrolase [Oscillospiraceae bacterium]|nr:MBL fold metallo-hydrolase [Oscillospiraceae bacterium]